MTFQSAPTIAEAVIHFTGVGVVMANVLHFRCPGGYDEDRITDLANDIDAIIATAYLPWCAIGVSYVDTTVRGLENIVDFSASANDSAGAGTFTGDFTLPFNCSFCLTLRTASTGKSARGRFYAMPTSSDALSLDNTVSNTYRDGIQAGVEAILAAPEPDGWLPVVLSRRSAGALRVFGVGYDITTVDARNNIMDSQRGRLPQGH